MTPHLGFAICKSRTLNTLFASRGCFTWQVTLGMPHPQMAIRLAVTPLRKHPCLRRPPGKAQGTATLSVCSLPGALLTARPLLRGLAFVLPHQAGTTELCDPPCSPLWLFSPHRDPARKFSRTGTSAVCDEK